MESKTESEIEKYLLALRVSKMEYLYSLAVFSLSFVLLFINIEVKLRVVIFIVKHWLTGVAIAINAYVCRLLVCIRLIHTLSLKPQCSVHFNRKTIKRFNFYALQRTHTQDQNRYHEDIFGITLRTAEIHNKSRATARIRMASQP